MVAMVMAVIVGAGPGAAAEETASAPSPPQELTAEPALEGILLTWQEPASDGGSPLEEYNVYRSEGAAGDWVEIGATVNRTFVDQTLNETGLAGVYQYVVTAINELGESDPSEAVLAFLGSCVSIYQEETPPGIELHPQDCI